MFRNTHTAVKNKPNNPYLFIVLFYLQPKGMQPKCCVQKLHGLVPLQLQCDSD